MNRLVRPLLLPLVLSLPAAAQLPQPGASGVATEVVVTAGAVPEDAVALGVATTVIDRATIERSRAATVADLLRTRPRRRRGAERRARAASRRSSCAGRTRTRPSSSSTA